MDEYSHLIMDKLIQNYEFNYAEIALGLAKLDPRMFCELAKISEEVGNNPLSVTHSYHKLIDPYLRRGDFIQAIKELRSLTGWGLKESKDFCDERRAKLGLGGPAARTPVPW